MFRRDPLNPLVFLEPGQLTFGVVRDFSLKLGEHLGFGELAFEVAREVAVFETKVIHSFPRETVLVKAFYFGPHAASHPREEACMDAFTEFLGGYRDADEEGIIEVFVFEPRNASERSCDLNGAQQSTRIFCIDRFCSCVIEFFEEHE